MKLTVPRNKGREGQVISHVFVFLIGAFVMAAIMLLGWRALSTLQEQQCAAQEASFVRDVQDAFTNNIAKGKTRTLTFSLPCGSDQVCFVPRKMIDDAALTTPVIDPALSAYPTIEASVTSGDQSNVFLRTDGKYSPVAGFTNAAPIADGSITCIDGDTVDVTFKGTGQVVAISRPTP